MGTISSWQHFYISILSEDKWNSGKREVVIKILENVVFEDVV